MRTTERLACKRNVQNFARSLKCIVALSLWVTGQLRGQYCVSILYSIYTKISKPWTGRVVIIHEIVSDLYFRFLSFAIDRRSLSDS